MGTSINYINSTLFVVPMALRELILEFIKQTGPALPVQVSKKIQTNILFASAHLSELSSRKEIKVSALKVGSSPLYYLPGQEPQLERFTVHLHEKERQAYDLLKTKRVLRDSETPPAMKVALRSISDFAIPLDVSHDNTTEIFWKWYSITNNVAEDIIKGQLMNPEERPAPVQPLPDNPPRAQKDEHREQPSPTPVTTKKEPPRQQTLMPSSQPMGVFRNALLKYLRENKIGVLTETIIRKDADIEFIIELPTAVGNATYYCRAKSKSKVNEGDLSAAYLTAQSKQLPVLFLTNGSLTKRATMLLSSQFKGMVVKKI